MVANRFIVNVSGILHCVWDDNQKKGVRRADLRQVNILNCINASRCQEAVVVAEAFIF